MPQPSRLSESSPLPASGLVDLHYHQRGTVVMPGIVIPEPPKKTQGALDLADAPVPRANLAPEAWLALREPLALTGDLDGDDAKGLVRRLFRVALAVGHAPSFQAEHRESLAQDWMRLPIPKDPATFDTATRLGDRIAELLDPLKEPDLTAFEDRAIVRKVGTDPLDTRVTYGYFGGGRGRYDAAKGELWLNDRTYLENVPEAVWRHELGGYPVVKKWLGYREARRRNGGALTSAELDTLKGIVRRLAALLALTSELDAVASAAQASAWSAEELGL